MILSCPVTKSLFAPCGTSFAQAGALKTWPPVISSLFSKALFPAPGAAAGFKLQGHTFGRGARFWLMPQNGKFGFAIYILRGPSIGHGSKGLCGIVGGGTLAYPGCSRWPLLSPATRDYIALQQPGLAGRTGAGRRPRRTFEWVNRSRKDRVLLHPRNRRRGNPPYREKPPLPAWL